MAGSPFPNEPSTALYKGRVTSSFISLPLNHNCSVSLYLPQRHTPMYTYSLTVQLSSNTRSDVFQLANLCNNCTASVAGTQAASDVYSWISSHHGLRRSSVRRSMQRSQHTIFFPSHRSGWTFTAARSGHSLQHCRRLLSNTIVWAA